MASDFLFTLMTNDPALAERADRAGVDRIGVDLDRLGKTERQPAGYRISNHHAHDLDRLRKVVRRGRLFARTDAPSPALERQIDDLISRGAKSLMLPMFHTADEAERFVDAIRGRAETILLVETPAALVRLHRLIAIPGVDEIYIGLNDLQLGLKLDSRFEFLASDMMTAASDTVTRAGIRFGFGGLGGPDDESLPVPSSLIYPHYARLGATSAILARSFVTASAGRLDTCVAAARERLHDLAESNEPKACLERLRSFLARSPFESLPRVA